MYAVLSGLAFLSFLPCFFSIAEDDFTSSVDALSSQKEKADKLIEHLQQELEARNNEMTAMKENELSQKEEKELLLNEVQQLSEAVELLKEKGVNAEGLKEEMDALTDKRAKLEEQLSSAEEELSQLKQVNEQLQIDVENAKGVVASSALETVTGGESTDAFKAGFSDVVSGTSLPEDTLSEEASPIVEESISLQLEAPLSSPSVDPTSSEELENVRGEMSEIQAELSRVKTLNERLKAKLRAQMKKEKTKSGSTGDYDSSEMKADIDKARQERLNAEKTIHELREQLDEVVRRKDGFIGDLKTKAQQLLDEKARNGALVEKCEKLVAEKDEEINRLSEKAVAQVQKLKGSYQLLSEETKNNADRYEQILTDKEAEIEKLKTEFANAEMESELLNGKLQEAQQSLVELNKLKGNFDHIVSGLREDLQQALDEKAAADQLAHEFRVQLKRNESSSNQDVTVRNDVSDISVQAETSQLEAKLQASLEEVASLKEVLESVTNEKEELDRNLETLKEKGVKDSEETKVRQAAIDSKDGENSTDQEFLSLTHDTPESLNDVIWLQSELKETAELNKKLKAALKKKRSRTRSDSREDDASNELKAELERARVAKIDSDRQVTELRLELDNFVRDKEKIVAAFKSKIDRLLQEKEHVSSFIEQHEKQLLEKDSLMRDLTEQFHILDLENEALKKNLENTSAMRAELELTEQANMDLERRQENAQSLINDNNKRIFELESELSNTKEKYEKEIEVLKQDHERLLSETVREADEAVEQLRHSNTELQQTIQAAVDEKGVIEKKLSEAKFELERVVQESYPLIEEKDGKIKELASLMESKQREADEIIAQLQENEGKLQEEIQVLKVTTEENKNQLEHLQSRQEKQMQEFELRMDENHQQLQEEKEKRQNERNDLEEKLQEQLMRSQENTSNLEQELAQSKSEIESLNTQLHVAAREKQDIEKLQSDFNHIISGLREDLQRALDGKAAADEIAHEFQVQLENLRQSDTEGSEKANGKSVHQKNMISEMLEAAQREVADVRAALVVTVKERDDLNDKVNRLQVMLEQSNQKELIARRDSGIKDIDKENAERPLQEVIVQSSVDNQLTASPVSEGEVELENMKNEMQRIKGLNEKLKAKLRTVMKKKRVKSESGDEDLSERERVQNQLEKIRQEKIESEKTCQELRVELDAFVRQKENIVNELKGKVGQLKIENEKRISLIEQLEKQIEEKNARLQDLQNDVGALESDNDQAWKNVGELRQENANLCVEIDDLVSQRNESQSECSQLKLEQDKLVEEYEFLVEKKDKTISNLEKELEDTTEKDKTEIRATRDQHEGIIFQIQSNADTLEKERLSACREVEQLKSRLRELNEEREDIGKLKVNFDHIVSSLREDLQHALEGKAAADQIAHEFQVQLKRLEKISGKLETQYSDVAVDTSDIERGEEITQQTFEAVQKEAERLHDALQSTAADKANLENRIRVLEAEALDRELSDRIIKTDEADGDRKEVVSEALIRSPENELLLASPPERPTFFDSSFDSEDVQKLKDDLSKAQAELEKFKTVNERLKAKLKAMIRKSKDTKSEIGGEGSIQELKDELNKTRQEKFECEKSAQQLRVDLDAFVREKERLVSELKEKIQQMIAEMEESNTRNEKYQNLLLEKDAEIGSLSGQVRSLSEDINEVSRELESNVTEKQNLTAVLEQVQLQRVKVEKELQEAKIALDHLLQGDKPLLDEKDERIAVLEAELSSQKELYVGEVNSLKDRYGAVISQQQNHADNLEQALTASGKEVIQLQSQLHVLEKEREDINKLRKDFDHIVTGLREDLQSAQERTAAADEIAYEFQMKLKRAEKSAVSSEVEVQDICIGTEDSFYLSGKESEIQELHAALDHLREEKEELEERVAGRDEVVQDREGIF